MSFNRAELYVWLRICSEVLGVSLALWMVWTLYVPEAAKIEIRGKAMSLLGQLRRERLARHAQTEMWRDVIDLCALGHVPERWRGAVPRGGAAA